MGYAIFMKAQYLNQTMFLGYAIMSKSNVLFLCTGNSARSQMAEALLRWHAADHFNVFSAGLEPKAVNPLAIRVMEEMGISMSSHRPKHLSEYVGKMDFTYLITVCGNAEENCPYFPGMGQRLHWGFDDPAAVTGSEEEKLAAFRRVRDEIDGAILHWLAQQGIQAAR